MCGLIGAAGPLTNIEDKIIGSLLIVDSLRGTDSTGMAVIARNNDVKMAKAVGNPYELIGTKVYDKALVGLNKAIIGHNRYGTQGKINKQNAHPFEFDALVGAHNGTLSSKYRLKDSRDFDVDSENLFHHINENGLYSALEHLEGAWSLVWWDKLENTLNFLRNKERPMYMTKNAAGTCLFWASEPWMLQGALGRAGVGYQPITETVVDMHYSFEIGDNGEVGKPRVTEMKSRAVPFVQGPSYSTWNNGVKITNPVANVKQGGGVSSPLATASANNGSSTNDATPTNVITLGNVPPQQQRQIVSAVSKTLHLSAENSYAYSKDVELVVLGFGSDSFGARYAMCEDEQNITRLIRLYIKNGDRQLLVGDEFTADIGPLVMDMKANVSYYKVSHSSVKYEQDPVGDTSPLTYKDANGKEISLDEFMTRYCQCAACTGWIDPDKPHRFVQSSDDAICQLCTEDKEVGQYIRLR